MKKIEFILVATIYVNENGIVNDDRYDYESIGILSLHHLGEVVCQYEIKRKPSHTPDISIFL